MIRGDTGAALVETHYRFRSIRVLSHQTSNLPCWLCEFTVSSGTTILQHNHESLNSAIFGFDGSVATLFPIKSIRSAGSCGVLCPDAGFVLEDMRQPSVRE
ncbi:hypothetical protein SCLCIDRAFT_251720 [Scleroderma citrinum Foug A]|uniref:Uncharacterized protein n=1 Tax=Scleroderma citrinum Foug A TaxID=1036808 RepID=A0A0C3E1T6_9AGAM|nr:hypothetical protein SCLCIDRAFT_251720 [Scleroderma citrinum Foug A]